MRLIFLSSEFSAESFGLEAAAGLVLSPPNHIQPAVCQLNQSQMTVQLVDFDSRILSQEAALPAYIPVVASLCITPPRARALTWRRENAITVAATTGGGAHSLTHVGARERSKIPGDAER